MMNSLISIAMATYNGEKFIAEQLDSILSQSYGNLEIIICDDHSTDSTPAILKNYAMQDGRIKVFFNAENLGLVKNFEIALSLCGGEYIALADQDDIWEKEKIATLLQEIGDCALIHSDASLIDGEGKLLAPSYSRYSRKILGKDIYSYLLHNNVTGCTALFSRKLLEYALPFPDHIFVHDWWLTLCAYKFGGITYIDEPLIRYRQHGCNQIGAADTRKIHPFNAREKAYKKTLMFMKTLMNVSFFSSQEKNFITEVHSYFSEFFSNRLRPRSFLFHLRYFNYLNEGKPFLYKLIGLFLSFFGDKIQRLMWRHQK
ncbi:MAG TPA: glycosyltransferase family 2 protein [Sulfuricurvum sp.]|nr:glycosyltransferase family 2 protein [Sulfuricurvum sp.]